MPPVRSAVADDPARRAPPDALGPNAWLVDEMYEQYLADPTSVSESWQDFFADYRRDAAPRRRRPGPGAPRPAPAPPPPRRRDAGGGPRGSRIRGGGGPHRRQHGGQPRRPHGHQLPQVPAKLLEVNRRVINGYLGRTRGGKVSFTHLIGYAVVRAIADRCR